MASQIAKVQRIREPLHQEELPSTEYITLNEVVAILARHYVEIPEEVARRVESFSQRWLDDPNLPPAARLLPPTGMLANLYRKWVAANVLHWELMEHGESGPVWRNWQSTGQAVRLDPDGRKRATSILELIIQSAKQTFDAMLSGQRTLRPSARISYSSVFNEADRQWLNCLGFETKEIFGFLGDLGRVISERENVTESEPDWIPTSMIVSLFGAWRGRPKTSNWPGTFSNPAPALKESAQRSQGQGKEALWHPVAVALWLQGKKRWPVSALDEIFASDSLTRWQPIWKPESDRLRRKLGQER